MSRFVRYPVPGASKSGTQHSQVFLVVAAPIDITGTLAVTTGNDTLSATGLITVTGSLALTLGNDTLAASGLITVTGTLARTLANDTLSASGLVTVTGSLARTTADDTMAASGDVAAADITGSLAETLADDTLAATGSITVTGTLARTLANDTLSASGLVTVTGSLARTLANDTLAAAGAVTVTGTLARTTGNDTMAATGEVVSGDVTGSMDVTTGDDTMESVGVVPAPQQAVTFGRPKRGKRKLAFIPVAPQLEPEPALAQVAQPEVITERSTFGVTRIGLRVSANVSYELHGAGVTRVGAKSKGTFSSSILPPTGTPGMRMRTGGLAAVDAAPLQRAARAGFRAKHRSTPDLWLQRPITAEEIEEALEEVE